MKTKLSLIALALSSALIASGQTAKPETKLQTQFSGHQMSARTNGLSPAEAARSFTVPDDLEMEQVLAEPIVRQPVFLNFDERGRMWVVQYLQYPAPAGLTPVSRDNFWRAVYDKVPEPPPRGVKGRDKITIHEDMDGDGVFDKHTTFVDGLNIATACVKGRGGVWVLNPPYLLFYPDKNDDDVPDGDPVVHLAGFGLEDTHSVVNSLRWGPDGWLYAAQGSTVTANVRVAAGGSNGVMESWSAGSKRAQSLQHSNTPSSHSAYSQGQNIWRYHPEKHLYEVFSEGGGNAFGVEFDDQGRLFSGHNGGDTRGFHYMQGAYLRKGFEKHGELSNPYAFGYFPHMDGTKGERFTHNFILYHGGALPERYNGKLFGIEPLQGRVVLSDFTPEGSTFKTRDIERVVTSSDSWFRPVDIKVGPDGAIYIADWYDRQVTHTRNQEGNIDTSNGRIYRLRARTGPRQTKAGQNYRELKTADLIRLLDGPAQWQRQTALQLLVERNDPAAIPVLLNRLESRQSNGLETLWALHQLGKLDDTLAARLLNHRDPQMRLWTVRLLGDAQTVSPAIAVAFAKLAGAETNSEVRAQLAATAKRLPATDSLPMLSALLLQANAPDDSRVPLLCWWAVESKCELDRDAVLKLFAESPVWFRPMVEEHILSRLMRRFAAPGTRKDLLTCARLLDLAPSPKHTKLLMTGFEEAFAGRPLTGLPEELIQSIARHDAGSDALKVRTGDRAALARALKVIADPQVDTKRRQQLISVLGEVHPTSALEALLRVADNDAKPELRKSALSALISYDDARIPATVLKDYNAFAPEVRTAALTLLTSRATWALAFAQAVDKDRIKAAAVPLDSVRRMKLHKNAELAALIAKHWPQTGLATTAEMQQQIKRLAGVVHGGTGNPYAGQTLFNSACASCHTLFARGGKVGPDLTAYQRGDLDTMLLHIVNPSAEIREGYENFQIETKDERSLSGFLVERDAQVVVIRGADGQNISVEQKDVAEMRNTGMSLMPEGLLDALSEQQVRDLFAYLRSTQPLAN